MYLNWVFLGSRWVPQKLPLIKGPRELVLQEFHENVTLKKILWQSAGSDIRKAKSRKSHGIANGGSKLHLGSFSAFSRRIRQGRTLFF